MFFFSSLFQVGLQIHIIKKCVNRLRKVEESPNSRQDDDDKSSPGYVANLTRLWGSDTYSWNKGTLKNFHFLYRTWEN